MTIFKPTRRKASAIVEASREPKAHSKFIILNNERRCRPDSKIVITERKVAPIADNENVTAKIRRDIRKTATMMARRFNKNLLDKHSCRIRSQNIIFLELNSTWSFNSCETEKLNPAIYELIPGIIKGGKKSILHRNLSTRVIPLLISKSCTKKDMIILLRKISLKDKLIDRPSKSVICALHHWCTKIVAFQMKYQASKAKMMI